MTQTTARINRKEKHFEIMVDLDDAMKFRKGETNFIEPEGARIFTDLKKGERASPSDLEFAFGTEDVNVIAGEIVKKGEVLLTQEYRDAEQEKKFKQIIDFLVTNAIDPRTGNPITAEKIKTALNEAQVHVKNVPVENQIQEILGKISSLLPIKLETKKVKITIPAIHTGRAYGVVANYKEKENWLNDGSLEIVVKVPAGLIMDFYDKLNSVTHGSALTEEIREAGE